MPFSSVIGHSRVTALLSRAVARDTVPPSLLLAGPRGVGKRRLAEALAQALNCLDPRAPGASGIGALEHDACGACMACRRIARGIHPDVLIVEPGDTGSIKIEHVRPPIDRAQYRPFEGRRRVVIIDDADAMTPEAQSALLKTLEEPPSASIFVLVSAIPDSLLPTVRSRCPRLRFGPLSAADVAGALMRDHGYAETDARAAAAHADGSVGRALAEGSVDVTAARAVARRLIETLAHVGDPSRRLAAARSLDAAKGSPASERDDLSVVLRSLSSLLRDLGILSMDGDARLLANADMEADLSRLTGAWDGPRSMRAFVSVDEALSALDRNAAAKVVADWLVMRL